MPRAQKNRPGNPKRLVWLREGATIFTGDQVAAGICLSAQHLTWRLRLRKRLTSIQFYSEQQHKGHP
jgi:hypothetical protein